MGEGAFGAGTHGAIPTPQAQVPTEKGTLTTRNGSGKTRVVTQQQGPDVSKAGGQWGVRPSTPPGLERKHTLARLDGTSKASEVFRGTITLPQMKEKVEEVVRTGPSKGETPEKVNRAIARVLPKLAGDAAKSGKAKQDLGDIDESLVGYTLKYNKIKGEVSLFKALGGGNAKCARTVANIHVDAQLQEIGDAQVVVYANAMRDQSIKRDITDLRTKLQKYEQSGALKHADDIDRLRGDIDAIQDELAALEGQGSGWAKVREKFMPRSPRSSERELHKLQKKRSSSPHKFSDKDELQLSLLESQKALEESQAALEGSIAKFPESGSVEEFERVRGQLHRCRLERQEYIDKLRAGIDKEAALGFALTQIGAPYVVQVHSVKPGHGYFMDLCRGGDAEQRIAKERPASIEQAKEQLTLFIQMAVATGFLHDPDKIGTMQKIARGIDPNDPDRELLELIRQGSCVPKVSLDEVDEETRTLLQQSLCNADLKPGNFFVRVVDGKASIAMGDLGEVKAEGEDLDASTHQYDAGERKMGRPVYTPGDCAALGFCLHELFYGDRFGATQWTDYKEEGLQRLLQADTPINNLIKALTDPSPDRRVSAYDAVLLASKALSQMESDPEKAMEQLQSTWDSVVETKAADVEAYKEKSAAKQKAAQERAGVQEEERRRRCMGNGRRSSIF